MAETRLHRSGLGLIVVGLAVYAVALSVPHWFRGTDETSDVYMGVWKFCGYFQKTEVCKDYSNIPGLTNNYKDWLTAVQGLQATGLVLAVVGLFISAFLFYSPANLQACRTAGASLIAAGLFGFIGAIVFIAKETSDDGLLLKTADYACYITFVGIFFFFVAGAIHLARARVTILQAGYLTVG